MPRVTPNSASSTSTISTDTETKVKPAASSSSDSIDDHFDAGNPATGQIALTVPSLRPAAKDAPLPWWVSDMSHQQNADTSRRKEQKSAKEKYDEIFGSPTPGANPLQESRSRNDPFSPVACAVGPALPNEPKQGVTFGGIYFSVSDIKARLRMVQNDPNSLDAKALEIYEKSH